MARARRSIGVSSNPRGSGRVRILKAFDPFTFKTQQSANRKRVPTVGGVTMSPIDIPKSQVVKQGMTKTRQSVRRLFVKDPYNMNSVSGPMATGATVARFAPEADQLTNSVNPKFDPSKGPGAVTELTVRDVSSEKPGKASRGHQKVVKRTIFNQNLGKKLRSL
jgi:hypothetical protein